MTPDQLRKKIRTTWDKAWDRGEFGPMRELMADDFRRIGDGSPKGMSLDETIATIVMTRAAFPDLVTIVDEIVIEDDVAAVRWHSVGTHEGNLLGVPPTNRKIEVRGANFMHFENDRVSHEFVSWDTNRLLTALGIITVDSDR